MYYEEFLSSSFKLGCVEQTDPSAEADDTIINLNKLPSLPLPSRKALLGQSPFPQVKPALLGNRPLGGGLPTPFQSILFCFHI